MRLFLRVLLLLGNTGVLVLAAALIYDHKYRLEKLVEVDDPRFYVLLSAALSIPAIAVLIIDFWKFIPQKTLLENDLVDNHFHNQTQKTFWPGSLIHLLQLVVFTVWFVIWNIVMIDNLHYYGTEDLYN